MQKYYTPAEVAQELRVTRRTVYEWLTTGRLRGMRAGSRWRIRLEDVERFLQPAAPPSGEDRTREKQEIDLEERAARIRAARGSMAHIPVSVDEVIQWKLDASALMAFLDNEPGADVVEGLLLDPGNTCCHREARGRAGCRPCWPGGGSRASGR
jgi:excisionase family DNA binding protein